MTKTRFDLEFEKAQRRVTHLFIAGVVINLAVLGGIVWLVVTLLKHFGVIA